MKNQGRFIYFFILKLATLLSVSAANGEIMGQYVTGEYVIKLKNSQVVLNKKQMGKMMTSLNVQVKDVISSQASTLVIKRSLLERPEAVIAELESHPMVQRVEPNYIYQASLKPNDSRLDELWGLINKSKDTGGVDIDAQSAWDITTGDRKIVVAVIDTGINYLDNDLKNNMWVNQAEALGQHGVDDDGNGFIDDIHGYDFANNDGDPIDDNNHGSHCSGSIGAEGNNSAGVVGVNWQVSLMALKFLTNSGSGTLENALKAIDYATSQGVNIMSNSWGGGGYSETLKEAIERAEQAGILFVAAAGNDSSNNDIRPSYPASYNIPNVLSVAAIDKNGSLASFSNYGKTSVHIAAPGVDILSTGKNGLLKLSGTSMATPHVAGVAALLLASEPNLTYLEIKERILNTSIPSVKLRGKVSHGILNAYNTLTNTLPPPDVNDPSLWPSEVKNVSTDHPYSKDQDVTYKVSVPGAQKVSVHFSQFDLENSFDKVTFYDGSGKKLGEMTGVNHDSYSPVASGDTIVLRFTSDYSVNRYGFDIDRAHYR